MIYYNLFILCSSITFQYIIAPLLITGALILIPSIYSSIKNERINAARGGVRNMYSELFDAIKKMPEYDIKTLNKSTVTAKYLNNSNKHCKIDVFTAGKYTYVTFSILYKGKWIETSKENFYGSLSGGELLLKIILNFPDCDLSYETCE